MQLADELRKLLGAEAVASDPETLAAHGGDKWFAAETPEVVVFARSTADVSKLLKFASREKVPVTPRGAGFGYVGGCVPVRKGIALSLMRMNRIKEINFADSVAIVGPGEHEGLQHWGQHRDERGRPPLSEIWCHPQLCHRPGSSIGERGSVANRRTRAQKQDRIRFDRTFCRLGRNAR